MTRELKLALIVGFLLVLVVTILISDHLSKARTSKLASDLDPRAMLVDTGGGAPITPADLNRTRTASAAPAPAPVNPAPVEPTRVADAGTTALVPAGPIAGPAAIPAPSTPTTVASGDPAALPSGMEPVGDTSQPITLTQGRTPRDVPASPSGPSIGSALDQLEQQLRNGGLPVAGQVDRLGGQPGDVRNPVTPVTQATPGNTGNQVTPVLPVMPVTPVTPAAAERFHTVKEGESLFQITKRYYGDGNRWKKLQEANGDRIGKNGEVRPGVRIKLPPDEVVTGKPAKAGTAAPVTSVTSATSAAPARTSTGSNSTSANPAKPVAAPATTRTYTVVAGDTLSEIARKTLGTSKRADEIFALNKLKDRNSIFVGMKLNLPAK